MIIHLNIFTIINDNSLTNKLNKKYFIIQNLKNKNFNL